jgi:hypothetical protein
VVLRSPAFPGVPLGGPFPSATRLSIERASGPPCAFIAANHRLLAQLERIDMVVCANQLRGFELPFLDALALRCPKLLASLQLALNFATAPLGSLGALTQLTRLQLLDLHNTSILGLQSGASGPEKPERLRNHHGHQLPAAHA